MNLITKLQEYADQFNEYWESYLRIKKPQTLYKAAAHLPHGGGKRLRPTLSMLACESVGGTRKQALPFGASLELTHNFTLVHDDIMDHSQLRRNLPTVHLKYGEPTAILAGDLMFTTSFQAMQDAPVASHILKQLNQGLIACVLAICEGQQLDIEFEQKDHITEQEYFEMITKKTAVLFEFAAYGGALIAGGTEQQAHALKNYGRQLGLAFQIWDDYLDMSSDEETLGKDIGNDIRNGKKTLIAVYALEHATGAQKQLLQRVFGNAQATDEDIRQVCSIFKEIGAILYARDKARQFNKQAKQELAMLPKSKAKTILHDLADFAIERET